MKSARKLIEYRDGDISVDYLKDPKAILLQQCNCVALKIHNNPKSLSYNLAKTMPYSNPYQYRSPYHKYRNLARIEDRPKPGSIQIMNHSNNEGPFVCCLFAQYRMGNSFKSATMYYMKYDTDEEYKNTPDDKCSRLMYFTDCLDVLAEKLNNEFDEIIDKVIIPKYIGCGMAGGEWFEYEQKIKLFSQKIDKQVIIVNYKKI